MSISDRLKEERLRLGLSQTAFAELAGATKSAQIKWERGASAPTAPALSAFAEAGADVLYIVTGTRDFTLSADAAMAKADLDYIDRLLREPLEGDDEKAVLRRAKYVLERMLRPGLTPELPSEIIERAEYLLELVSNPSGLSLYRAADFAQKRKARENAKEELSQWFNGWPYRPNDAVINVMVMLSVDYGVPLHVLVELSHEIFVDLKERPSLLDQQWAQL